MKPKWRKTKHPRVFAWHEAGCPSYDDKRCRCAPKFRGEVWNPDTKRPVKQSPAVAHVNEAIGWVADFRRGVAAPAPVEFSGVSVREFFAAFMKSARAGTALRKGGKRYATRTLDKYDRDYRLHLDPQAGEKPVNAMDAQAWQVVVETVVTTGQRDHDGNPTGREFGPATVNTITAGIRAAYRWGAAPGRRIVNGNPLREVQIPQGGKSKRKRVAAPETIPALLDALAREAKKRGPKPNPAMRVAWAVMFYAGLRISEVIALDWADVDGGWITVGASKSDAGTDRRVPIAAPLAAILHDWRRERGGFVIGPVITGTRTLRATDSGVASAAAARWTEAGLPAYAPHEARHTFASAVIANRDVSLADLQEWLGHASIATTAVYVKTLPGFRSESAGARLSGAFGG